MIIIIKLAASLTLKIIRKLDLLKFLEAKFCIVILDQVSLAISIVP